MTQLDLLRVADQERAVRFEQQFMDVLTDGAWHLRREICRLVPGLTERACRQIAENSKGAVIGSAKGYKLTKHATVEELDHFERSMLSQGRKMIDRVREVRVARNRGGVAA
jgi:hypothetical protein